MDRAQFEVRGMATVNEQHWLFVAVAKQQDSSHSRKHNTPLHTPIQ